MCPWPPVCHLCVSVRHPVACMLVSSGPGSTAAQEGPLSEPHPPFVKWDHSHTAHPTVREAGSPGIYDMAQHHMNLREQFPSGSGASWPELPGVCVHGPAGEQVGPGGGPARPQPWANCIPGSAPASCWEPSGANYGVSDSERPEAGFPARSQLSWLRTLGLKVLQSRRCTSRDPTSLIHWVIGGGHLAALDPSGLRAPPGEGPQRGAGGRTGGVLGLQVESGAELPSWGSVFPGAGGSRGPGKVGGAGSSIHPCCDIKGSLQDHQCRVSQASLVTRAGHSDAGDTLGSQRSQGGLSPRVVESANCCPLPPGPGLPPP